MGEGTVCVWSKQQKRSRVCRRIRPNPWHEKVTFNKIKYRTRKVFNGSFFLRKNMTFLQSLSRKATQFVTRFSVLINKIVGNSVKDVKRLTCVFIWLDPPQNSSKVQVLNLVRWPRFQPKTPDVVQPKGLMELSLKSYYKGVDDTRCPRRAVNEMPNGSKVSKGWTMDISETVSHLVFGPYTKYFHETKTGRNNVKSYLKKWDKETKVPEKWVMRESRLGGLPMKQAKLTKRLCKMWTW